MSNFDESRWQNNGPHKNCGRGGIREIRGGAEKVQNRNSFQQRRNRRVQFTQIHRRHSQIYQRVGKNCEEIFTNRPGGSFCLTIESLQSVILYENSPD